MRRVFIALSLPKEICEKIGNIIKELSQQKLPVRWVRHESCHATLHFLGEQSEEAIEEVKNILLKIVPKYKRPSARLDKLDYFPSVREPRIIHLALKDEGNALEDLQKELGEELKKNGFEVEKRKWIAHVTLGRAKGIIDTNKWKDAKIPNQPFAISKVELMESRLAPEGARYFVL